MPTSTILQYNGVRLQNVQTLSFVETPINGPSGQYLYTHTELKVLGYITLKDAKTIGINPNHEDAVNQGATQQFSILKHYLEQPRRRLVYSVNATGSPGTLGADPGDGSGKLDPAIGLPLFVIIPAQEKMISEVAHETDMLPFSDVHGGPIPKNVSITHIAGNQVWRVEFTVEFSTVSPCLTSHYSVTKEPDESVNPDVDLTDHAIVAPVEWTGSEHRKKGVLSNRWSVHDQIDDNGYTTRTYTGQVLLANSNWSPNDFRALTMFPLQPGMMRHSIDYQAAEDNLSLQYSVVDKEVTATAPWPARTMKIVHNESVGLDGSTSDFSIRVLLTGDRGTALFDLMQLAVAIIDQRLYLQVPNVGEPNSSVLVHRQDITTEQGTDSTQIATIVVSGKRFIQIQQEFGLVFRTKVQKLASMRPFKSTFIELLKQYDNQLSFGNRANEQPPTEGSIPAITALHARLATPCTTKFDIQNNMYTDTVTTEQDYLDDRTATQNRVAGAIDDWSPRISGSTVATLAPYESTLVFSSQHRQALYSHYKITSVYNLPGLNVALPVAVTDSAAYLTPLHNVVVSIGPQQPTRTIRVEAERAGTPPALPSPLASFTESGVYIPGVGTTTVTNTLLRAQATYREPQPLADGNNLLYTSYLELEYSQNRHVGYHRFGIPAMIASTADGDPLADKGNYSYPIDSMFLTGGLTGHANFDSSHASINS